eukprot:CAMPEP_0196777266 /NCGR_PEP_ID=MMETSP1104-20130614/5121_1 /TAXON_ID=33652 /ORGANISM="Cafeteria sp., Strain Caron Lab Isolate" /LENGTH=463 /DNA_ID=CAMNT_0042147433 /DNA_START=67 /DNA_END=1454 /DNA_ORIENTATION=-
MKRLRIVSNVLLAGSAIELCAFAAYTYVETYKVVWSAAALIGASVVHMVLALFGCLVFQSERSVHALATLCMIQLSTVAILVLSACAYFFERQGDDYVSDNWARLQDIVVPFETLHDVQDAIADNVNKLSIAGIAAAAASTGGILLLWFVMRPRYWKRAATAAAALTSAGLGVATLILLIAGLQLGSFALGRDWLLPLMFQATAVLMVAELVVLCVPFAFARPRLSLAFRWIAPPLVLVAVELLVVAAVVVSDRWDQARNQSDASRRWDALRPVLPPHMAAWGPTELSDRADAFLLSSGWTAILHVASVAVLAVLMVDQSRGEHAMDPYLPFSVWWRRRMSDARRMHARMASTLLLYERDVTAPFPGHSTWGGPDDEELAGSQAYGPELRDRDTPKVDEEEAEEEVEKGGDGGGGDAESVSARVMGRAAVCGGGDASGGQDADWDRKSASGTPNARGGGGGGG